MTIKRPWPVCGLLAAIIFTVGGLEPIISAAFAGEADVIDVSIKKTGENTFTFVVSVRHADTGWQHYANRWEIFAPDETIIATRILYHPHIDEQPFTRRLEKVVIPEDVQTVAVRAHDTVHQYGGKEVIVKLPR